MSSIDWSDAAIDAAKLAFVDAANWPHTMRAALDAAVELQGLETIGYRASEKAFESGRRVGRADALEEAVRACEGDFDSGMRSYGKVFAAAIRALKDTKINE